MNAHVHALGLAAAVLVAAQGFKTTTELVTIPIAVTTSRDRADTSLSAADFRVLEDGIEQPVAAFAPVPPALSVCLLVDQSGSMRGSKITLAMTAVREVFRQLRPVDEVAVVFVSDRPVVALGWTAATSLSSLGTLRVENGGATALVDGLETVLRLMDTTRSGQPVVLIISDGRETSSIAPMSRVARTRRQSEVSVYAIQPEAPPTRRIGPTPGESSSITETPIQDVLPQLVGDSGGFVRTVRSESAVPGAAGAILDDLRGRYLIGYTPTRPPDGRYRRIRVEPRVPNVKVRHRGGYLAMPPIEPR